MKMQYRGILIFTLLSMAGSGLAQKKIPPPQTSTFLHANRLRVGEIKPGHIYWQRITGNNSTTWTYGSPPFLVDFDGDQKPCAGLGETGLWLGALNSAGQVRVSCARIDGCNSTGLFTSRAIMYSSDDKFVRRTGRNHHAFFRPFSHFPPANFLSFFSFSGRGMASFTFTRRPLIVNSSRPARTSRM